MTADLTQVAVDFAREVLGWEDTDTFVIGRKQRVVRNLSASGGAGEIFNVSDLNAVVTAVVSWCDANARPLSLYYAEAPTKAWHVDTGGDSTEASNLSHALLAACVAASRKLKAA